MPKAKNGKSRGTCKFPLGHKGTHGNTGTCYQCGDLLTPANASLSAVSCGFGLCRRCALRYNQKRGNHQPRNFQRLGHTHTFPCGCSGRLPKVLGQSNKFAFSLGRSGYRCRVASIINGSRASAAKYGFTSIALDTPHIVIRKMMDDPICERCGEPLTWEIGFGKTPHLHHNHETGEIYGFTHPVCNPQALEREIERLKKLLAAGTSTSVPL
jgi:hypothetical protein